MAKIVIVPSMTMVSAVSTLESNKVKAIRPTSTPPRLSPSPSPNILSKCFVEDSGTCDTTTFDVGIQDEVSGIRFISYASSKRGLRSGYGKRDRGDALHSAVFASRNRSSRYENATSCAERLFVDIVGHKDTGLGDLLEELSFGDFMVRAATHVFGLLCDLLDVRDIRPNAG